jgi:hypothetical protein
MCIFSLMSLSCRLDVMSIDRTSLVLCWMGGDAAMSTSGVRAELALPSERTREVVRRIGRMDEAPTVEFGGERE